MLLTRYKQKLYALIARDFLGARIGFHQLIMATILMNNEQKKLFSKLYIRVCFTFFRRNLYVHKITHASRYYMIILHE